jgi:mRNA interferase RelE/StbE
MYRVELGRESRRFFERAGASLQRRLDKCFDRLKVDPRIGGSVKPLAGKLRGYYRYRVGDYRVIYRIDEQKQTVFVMRIAHRNEAYK